MYDQYRWTAASAGRNAMLERYEPLQPYLLLCLAERLKCDMFLDIGANIGAYSLFLSSVPTIGEIHAFEPNPRTFAELKRNVSLNGLETRIAVHQVAASNSSGTVEFGIVNALSGANSVISTSIHADSKFVRSIRVECCSLDDLISARGRRICLKIDVEGHEREALLGLRKLLSSNRVVVQIEQYDDGRDLMDIFDELGFRSLFQIGPDLYLTNGRSPGSADLIQLFEQASTRLVEASKRRTGDAQPPVNIPLGKLLNLQLLGPFAAAARQLLALLRHRK